MDFILLFASAFLAATLLPFYSEFLVVAAIVRMPEMLFWIWLVASLGNTLGAALNWLMGRYLLHYQQRKWFPFNVKQLALGQRWFQQYGVWSLLFAWLPIGGDPLTFIAGMMKVRFSIFFVLTFIGKALRYWVVIYFADVVYGAVA
jgi:membrane protein YqaA with SNARE-associated domain